MTHIPIQLPFNGFTEQSQFSVVPPGMTPSCVNVLPVDPWNGRMRIGTRNGTQRYNTGNVQFMSTYRVYESGQFVEKLIVVRDGYVYYADPHASMPVTLTLFGGQATRKLASGTGLVEGVQFNNHFYFVDGTNYAYVTLDNPTSGTAVSQWGQPGSTVHGPYHTDPDNVQAGERATLICRWGARLVLSGYRKKPNIWFACGPDLPYPSTSPLGAGLPTTADGWEAADQIGAIAGTSGSSYGTLSDPIVAIFPFGETGLMFGCTNSFAFLTGDPLFELSGGTVQMVTLTKNIGIAGRRAYCQSQEKSAFILANDGLYLINANDFNFSRGSRVSAGKLDSFFLRLDFGTPAIGGSGILSGGTLRSVVGADGTGSGSSIKTLTEEGGLTEEPGLKEITFPSLTEAFTGGLDAGQVFPVLCSDSDREGVWIFLTVSGSESSSLHVYYDLKTNSFWPQRFSDPLMYGPSSACYVGTSRTKSGKLFLGGTDSISVLNRTTVRGVDGYTSALDEDVEAQRSQLVRSSLTVGPIIAPLPYRIMLSEVRADMSDDEYELADGVEDASSPVILSVSTGETAQSALGLQSDKLFVSNLNPLIVECGGAVVASPSPVYNGGGAPTAFTNRIDGRFAVRPFGEYSQADPFAAGTTRVYDGPANWKIIWNGTKWVIEDGVTLADEYRQQVADDSPNGLFENIIDAPLAPHVLDFARVSAASFPTSEITEIAELQPGRNPAKKCRVRAEAAYLSIASDGRPWAIERMSVIVSQVGKSRGNP